MGLFDKIKQGLKKTTQLLNTDVRDLFKNEGRLVDDAFLEELLEKLVKTDMGVQPAQAIVAEVGTQFRARVVEMDDVLASVKAKLRTIMAQPEAPIQLCRQRADRDHGGRRQRGRKDHLDRKACLPVKVAGKESRAGGGRHVSRGRGGTTDDLGRPAGRADRDRARRVATRPRWPTKRSPRPWRAGPTSASSIRPAACRRSRI